MLQGCENISCRVFWFSYFFLIPKFSKLFSEKKFFENEIQNFSIEKSLIKSSFFYKLRLSLFIFSDNNIHCLQAEVTQKFIEMSKNLSFRNDKISWSFLYPTLFPFGFQTFFEVSKFQNPFFASWGLRIFTLEHRSCYVKEKNSRNVCQWKKYHKNFLHDFFQNFSSGEKKLLNLNF